MARRVTAGPSHGRGVPRWVHRLALVTAGATLLLIFAGGLVTNTGSGLAVPDWPTTFGQNMFLYPWSGMVGGVFYEHSHRLLGALVGLLTLALAAGLLVAAPRSALRWWGLAAVAGVIVQGVLGGLRVVLLQHGLAIVHGILAQAFFALTVGLALCTSPGWARPAEGGVASGDGGRVRRLAAWTTGLIALQVVLGVGLTHTGGWFVAHLLVAGGVAVHVFLLAVRVLGAAPELQTLAAPTRWLSGLVIVQFVLGLGSYLARFTALGTGLSPFLSLALPATHRIVGSLMLASAVVLALRAARILGPPARSVQGVRPASERVPA